MTIFNIRTIPIDFGKADREQFSAGLEAWIQELTQKKKGKLKVEVTGKTGIVKSTLANALIGSKVVDVGDGLKSSTKEVTPYSKTQKGVEIIAWDSPGLQDGTDNEKEYLTEMKEKFRDNNY